MTFDTHGQAHPQSQRRLKGAFVCLGKLSLRPCVCLSLEKKNKIRDQVIFSHSHAGANTSKEVWDEWRGWVTFSSTREPVKTLGQISSRQHAGGRMEQFGWDIHYSIQNYTRRKDDYSLAHSRVQDRYCAESVWSKCDLSKMYLQILLAALPHTYAHMYCNNSLIWM